MRIPWRGVACGIAIGVAAEAMSASAAGSRTVYASPDGGPRRHDGRVVETLPLRDAVAGVLTNHADTVIQLVAGAYDLTGLKPITISRHQRDRKPYGRIILRGLGSATVIDGGRPPMIDLRQALLSADPTALQAYLGVPDLAMIDPEVLARLPHKTAFSCFRLEDQERIEIERLRIQGCWMMAVFAIDSNYITLRDSAIFGSQYAFHAFGDESHHFLLEGNHWRQDDSVTRRMWRRICWASIKGQVSLAQRHKACPLEGDNVRDFSHFNGAFFGSWNILGGVVVRNNLIENAFNGVRMDAPRSRRYRGTRNVNVEIYGNKFHYVRDNPVEPEATATNWWIHHNEIFNAHSWFSFDAVWGEAWYVFGNVGWFDERPYFGCHRNPDCQDCLADPDCNLAWAGKVLKYSPDGPYPASPVYVFNNSWYLRTPIAAGGSTRQLHHWNNAIEFCGPKSPDNGICQAINAPDGAHVERCESSSRPPPMRFFNADFRLPADGGNRFDHDLSNQCFPESLTATGQESHGVVAQAGERIFESPLTGDFRLPPLSPARDSGKVIELAGRVGWSSEAADGFPDIGAFEGRQPMRGPPYRHWTAAGLYPEPPRIVDVAWRRAASGVQLRVSFSVAIEDVATLDDRNIVLDLGDGEILESTDCRIEQATLVCAFPTQAPPPLGAVTIIFPDGIRGVPRDGRREPMELWASSHPQVSIRRR